MPLVSKVLFYVLFSSIFCQNVQSENVYCSYYRETNEVTCGTVTCLTHVPVNADLEKDGLDVKLPLGWYRIGTMQIRRDTAWFNLYRRRATGNGYWDFYTNIPERNCIGLEHVLIVFCFYFYRIFKCLMTFFRGFGLHAGDNIAGSITVKDKKCFDRLVYQEIYMIEFSLDLYLVSNSQLHLFPLRVDD
uniref:Fibrinogen C-terminal domain-containing protein n=1 Tax=Heterorhabditis bacteriophora TaxID=37862 RepID=A0A1I7XKB9_HETBA